MLLSILGLVLDGRKRWAILGGLVSAPAVTYIAVAMAHLIGR